MKHIKIVTKQSPASASILNWGTSIARVLRAFKAQLFNTIGSLDPEDPDNNF